MIAGRYSREREIGRGGMGAVWLGRDEVLGRQVALKRIGLLPGADRTDLARAEREARLAAQLNHAHVVGVFDVVVDPETDARWLVMEYVDGQTLAEVVRERGSLSPDDAAPLLRQAADALVAAHAAGIVHRDVKPSNILVDRNGRVKLTDFGIARIAADPALTQTGMVTGSPAYLAPEIATGARGDEAVDVWSLGATIFYVLAGRPPYEIGDNVLGGLYRIVNDDPPHLEAGWMTPLLEGTLVKDPSRRWTMEQVRDFLAGPFGRVAPTAPGGAVAAQSAADSAPDRGRDRTQELGGAGVATGLGATGIGTTGLATGVGATGTGAAAASAPPPTRASGGRRPPLLWLLAGGVALALLLSVVLFVALRNGDPVAEEPGAKPSATATTQEAEAEPTEEGIETFIRDYVDAVGADPATSWQMLTPKFQSESGGFDTYKDFWDAARNGRVLSISANPDNLSVSYQVRFDNFDNGPGPTVLDLDFEDGRYLIDGERSQGFTPAD